MPAAESHLHGFHARGYLPHLKRADANYFVTFRLADSLPRELLARLEEELAALSFPAHHSLQSIEAEKQSVRRRRIEALLDQGAGSCCLRDPDVAQLVAAALQHFNGTRYNVGAWVVMPNHVHVLVCPRAGHTLGSIVKSWKQFTSTHVKRLLALPAGRFWQPEAYDHGVRNEAERARIIAYIHNNPVKARLCPQGADWPWSSAVRTADFQSASAPPAD